MTKKSLVAQLAEEQKIRKSDAERVVNVVLDLIVGGLESEGATVALKGFGTFKVKTTKARTARNPSTGAEVQVAAKTKVKFKAAKEVDELLNS